MPNVQIPGVGVVAFPDSMTPEQIAAAIQKMPKPDRRKRDVLDVALAQAGPTLAQVGSAIATPLGPGARAAASGLGGATGKAIEQAAGMALGRRPMPTSIPQALSGVREQFQEGMNQAALSGGGESAFNLLGRAGKWAAPRLMRAGLNPPKKVVDVASESGSDTPWDVVLKTGTRVDRTGLAGQRELADKSRAAIAKASGVAEADPRRFNSKSLMVGVERRIREMRDGPLTGAERKQLSRLEKIFLRERKAPLQGPPKRADAPLELDELTSLRRGGKPTTTPKMADEGYSTRQMLALRRQADARLRELRERAAAGGQPLKVDDVRKVFFEEVGNTARRYLNANPAMKAANREASGLIGARKALRYAENAPNPKFGMDPRTWPGLNLVASPGFITGTAHASNRLADSPLAAMMAQYGPRALSMVGSELSAPQQMPDYATLRANLATAIANRDAASADYIRRQIDALAGDSGGAR